MSGQAELGPRPHEDAGVEELPGEQHVVRINADEHEAHLGRVRLRTDGDQRLGEVLPCVGDLAPPSRTNLVADAQRRSPGGERHAVHVERLIHDAEVSSERLVGDRAAEAKPGEAEELREAAQRDQRLPVDDVTLAPELPFGREEVHVGLVDDDHTPLGQRFEERLPLATLLRRSGRIVRIADPDELRVHLACLREQHLEVDAARAHRRLVDDGASRDGDHPVEVEGDGRLNHGVARLQKRRRDRADERLRAVPRHDAA